ncbi:hypothetical protein [Micromonospora pisi]|uniref:hypothetical protein n=1 Tax=Micromonospora pisi TaxID=589240 RepID=UPI001476A018|nr:hypothetical protein [Micromonospora pisi]
MDRVDQLKRHALRVQAVVIDRRTVAWQSRSTAIAHPTPVEPGRIGDSAAT